MDFNDFFILLHFKAAGGDITTVEIDENLRGLTDLSNLKNENIHIFFTFARFLNSLKNITILTYIYLL